MQTAIHFEGDQAYICVSDHGKIKEEEPVSYGRSRVEFVIQTAKAQEEGKIAVVFDDATGKIVKDAEEQCIRSGLRQGQVNFFTKEEAALGVVLFRGDNLAKGNTGIFDYTRKHFVYYEVKKQKDSVIVEAKDYTEQIKHAVTSLCIWSGVFVCKQTRRTKSSGNRKSYNDQSDWSGCSSSWQGYVLPTDHGGKTMGREQR